MKLRRDLDSDLNLAQLCGCDQRSLLLAREMAPKDFRLYLASLVLELAVRRMEKVVLDHRARASRAANSDRS